MDNLVYLHHHVTSVMKLFATYGFVLTLIVILAIFICVLYIILLNFKSIKEKELLRKNEIDREAEIFKTLENLITSDKEIDRRDWEYTISVGDKEYKIGQQKLENT